MAMALAASNTSCLLSSVEVQKTRIVPLSSSASFSRNQRLTCGLSFSSKQAPRPLSAAPQASIRSERLWNPLDSAEDVSSNQVWSIKRGLETPSSPFMASGIYAGQGQPPPMLQERFQGVISQLFQNRIIRCGGAVDDDMANLIVAQLLYLDAADPTRDIVMYVNSPGGSVTAGMNSCE
eukprot:TRINITY_DN263_c0_g1_i2.p1 TRINITY_DN263_c0_g1~~TRINITY_DN263_c0_g1_i2.p1  ORF type:complete len:179 (-),score=27.51 TRINITY_DN263_c0_g1_i2:176-712(-)